MPKGAKTNAVVALRCTSEGKRLRSGAGVGSGSGKLRSPSNGLAEEVVISQVLELLVSAILADVTGRRTDDGQVPQGNEP